MSYINAPTTHSWDSAKVADTAVLADLADVAVTNLSTMPPSAQEAILGALRELPVEQLDLEDIALCALAQDEHTNETDEYDDDVIGAAWEIVTREDVLPLIDVEAIMQLISAERTSYRSMQAGVAILEDLPAARIPFERIVALGKKFPDEDEGFDDAVYSLLSQYDRWDDMRQLYDADGEPDEDSYLGALCRDAIEAHESATANG